ncbi:unnamed protein product [Larinioides sclopetarius]|uniref:Uncharacterized protein n=1 Tax=Larinioides sclopetarius TaxID=280406 RepID=A0AAV1YR37_9ARAC
MTYEFLCGAIDVLDSQRDSWRTLLFRAMGCRHFRHWQSNLDPYTYINNNGLVSL